MSPEVWPAPAKLNLFLHVLGRREDGYHELQTLFQFLDLVDEVELAARGDGRIRRTRDEAGVSASEDLTVRAATLLKEASGTALGADVGLRKRIPLGGGLGGGSSDAATTLVGLNRLWGLDLPVDALAELGLRLGADVPVFVRGRAAWAEGVGERLEPVDIDTPWYLVVTPGCVVSTARVFSDPALTRDSPALTIRALLSNGGARLTVLEVLRRARNDCEPVVRALYPEVGVALDWLAARGVARMTGTGASVFAPFATREEAMRCHRQLPREWRGFVARGVNRSPLLPLR